MLKCITLHWIRMAGAPYGVRSRYVCPSYVVRKMRDDDALGKIDLERGSLLSPFSLSWYGFPARQYSAAPGS